MKKSLDAASLTVIAVTFILFTIALYAKGLTHDLLLEAGVFLVSVKLIITSYKNSLFEKSLQSKLNDISDVLRRIEMETRK